MAYRGAAAEEEVVAAHVAVVVVAAVAAAAAAAVAAADWVVKAMEAAVTVAEAAVAAEEATVGKAAVVGCSRRTRSSSDCRTAPSAGDRHHRAIRCTEGYTLMGRYTRQGGPSPRHGMARGTPEAPSTPKCWRPGTSCRSRRNTTSQGSSPRGARVERLC